MITLADPATRRSIAERISRIDGSARPVWGRMTAPQMICHLNDAFLTAFGEKYVSPAPVLIPPALMKFVALYVPAPWPKGIPTRPEVEQGVGGTPPKDFVQDRADLLRTIERFCGPDPAIGQHLHPIFGPLSLKQWMRWGYLHSDHHLRQFGV